MVTLTVCPLESSTSSTTSSVGICCVSWRKTQAQDCGPSATTRPHPRTGCPAARPHLLGLAQEAVEGLAASQYRVLPHWGRKAGQESGVTWERTGTRACAQLFCGPSVCTQAQCHRARMWAATGPPQGEAPAGSISASAGAWTVELAAS